MHDLISRQAAITLPVMPKEHREYQTFNLDDAYEQGWNDLQKCIESLPSADRPKWKWIPCSERLPETDNKNDINEYDVLLLVRAKKHPERIPQVYIGKLLHVDADDGSGNFWGKKTEPCEWTIWGWSYFQEPEVLAWMPLPEPYKEEQDE